MARQFALAAACSALTALIIPSESAAIASVAATETSQLDVLFRRCSNKTTNKVEGDQVAGFLKALNEQMFFKYDLSCNGELEGEELAAYLEDARLEALKVYKTTNDSVTERIAHTAQRERVAGIDSLRAERVPVNPDMKEFTFNFGYTDTNEPAVDKEVTSFDVKAIHKPIKTFRTKIPMSLVLGWDFGGKREESVSSTERVTTETLSIRPLSYVIQDPDERLKLELAVGGARVWTDKLIRDTEERVKTDQTTFAYSAKLSYTFDENKCWRVGVALDLKTRNVVSDTVSRTFGPWLGYNIKCLSN